MLFKVESTHRRIGSRLQTFNISNIQQVLHHMRDAVVSGNTFDVPLNNLERIVDILF